ncbi:MAG: hypothetical protein ACP5UN_03580 [Candidatus Micrarchaeia archaeon]
MSTKKLVNKNQIVELKKLLNESSSAILQIPQNNSEDNASMNIVNIDNLKEVKDIDKNWELLLYVNIKNDEVSFEIQCRIESYMKRSEIERFIKNLFKKYDAHRIIQASDESTLKITLDKSNYESDKEIQDKSNYILNEFLNNLKYFNYVKITKED